MSNLNAPLDQLMAEARAVRDARFGTRITYSPKVFVPLTMLCRDRCGYCTFAQPPARLDAPFLSIAQVRRLAMAGARVGCHEALFTLGEAPEERYPVAAEWLAANGYSSTVDHIIAAARVVLDETGLLPHANAGALSRDELARLRTVSPVTADHVNPERPWPDLDILRSVSEERGFVLAPRLTVHPEFALDPQRWIDPDLHFALLDRADAAGLARDDPGSVLPQRLTPPAPEQVDDGIEILQIGPRSTAWYSGASVAPPVLVPGPGRAGGRVAEVLEGSALGQTLGVDEIVVLFGARGPELEAVARHADELREESVGDVVTWVHNRNINYTNVCTFKCRFCGFSKGPLSLNLRGTPYLLTLDDLAQRTVEAAELGATEVCLQGGIHPDFDGDYYVDVTRAVKAAVPDIHVHGFTALEVTEGAKRLGEPLDVYLRRLMDAGLRTLPGTAAEILDDEIRAIICSDKIDTDEWLEAHRTAHSVGLRSNITIMFGSVEQPVHWARHIVRTRALQAETGGFTEFVPLPFVHMATPLYLQRKARRGPTFREALLMHAVPRIAYHGLIDNIQASWVKLGTEGARQMLQAGANDLGGTLMDENISRAAGADHGQGMEPAQFAELVAPLGRRIEQRTTLYGRLATA